MRKRITILAAATVLVLTLTTAWVVSSRRLGAQAVQVPAGFVPTKSGWMPDPSIRYNTNSPQLHAMWRRENSGCTLHVPPEFRSKDIDQDSAEALAVVFREQAPIPADRVEHFAWLDQAKELVNLVGWTASIKSAVFQGDGWLLELRVTPNLESETACGAGLTPDHYLETYLVHDGWFEYQGGRSPDVARHVIRPDPSRPNPDVYSFN